MTRLLSWAALALLVTVPALPAADEKKADDPKPAAKSTVAVFRLDHVSETATDSPFSFSAETPTSLRELLEHMKKAGDDPAIKAVVLLADDAALGRAQIEEVRQVMAQIRAAGKEIHAHADSLALGQYLLLAGASKISVAPT